jgi:hypothetical protein
VRGRLAVGAIDGCVAQVTDRCGEEPGAEILAAGQADPRCLGRFAAQDCNAVPRLLAVYQRAIAFLLERVVGKLLVGELELLQADDIGPAFAQPLQVATRMPGLYPAVWNSASFAVSGSG